MTDLESGQIHELFRVRNDRLQLLVCHEIFVETPSD